MFRLGGFALVSNSATLVLSAASFLVLVRILTPADFGVWALFLATVTFVDMARIGLVANSFIKFAASADEDRWKSLMTSGAVVSVFGLVLGVSLVSGLSSLLTRLWNAPSLLGLFADYWAMAVPYTFVIITRYMQQARSDFRAVMFTNLVYRGTFLVGIFVELLVFERINLPHLPWVMGLAGVFASIPGIWMVRRDLRFASIDWREVKQLLQFGKYVFATNLGSIIAGRALGAMAPAATVAVYSIPQRLGGYIEVPLSSVATVTYSRASATDVTDTAKFRLMYERSVGIMLAMLFPMIVVILAGSWWIIYATAGSNYTGTAAVMLLQITALLSVFKAYGRQFGVTMDALGLPHINAMNLWGSLAINVILNLVLIPIYGVYGAITATGISMTLGTASALVILQWKLGVQVLRPLYHAWEFYREAWQFVVQSVGSNTECVSVDRESRPGETGPGKKLI
jgi:lipopolysaccharide exporter